MTKKTAKSKKVYIIQVYGNVDKRWQRSINGGEEYTNLADAEKRAADLHKESTFSLAYRAVEKKAADEFVSPE